MISLVRVQYNALIALPRAEGKGTCANRVLAEWFVRLFDDLARYHFHIRHGQNREQSCVRPSERNL